MCFETMDTLWISDDKSLRSKDRNVNRKRTCQEEGAVTNTKDAGQKLAKHRHVSLHCVFVLLIILFRTT